MAEERSALEVLTEKYRNARGNMQRGIILGSAHQGQAEMAGDALKTQLAQLKDAQIASRAALKAGDIEASADANQALKIAYMRALATFGSSANSAAARRDANIRLDARELRDVLWGDMNYYAKRDFDTLRNQMVDQGQLTADSELLHEALRGVLDGVPKDADKGKIISQLAALLPESEAEFREKLGSTTSRGASFRDDFKRIDRARTVEDADKREARLRLAEVESELATLPGITYGGVLGSIVGLGTGTTPAGGEDAALDAAVEAIPLETNIMKETRRQIEGTQTISEILADAARTEEFQFLKEMYGFDNDRKLMNFLLRQRGEVEEDKPTSKEKKEAKRQRGVDIKEGRVQRGIELDEALYDAQNVPDLSSPEAVKAYRADLRKRASSDDVDYAEALRIYSEALAYIEDAADAPGVSSKTLEELTSAGRTFGILVDRIRPLAPEPETQVVTEGEETFVTAPEEKKRPEEPAAELDEPPHTMDPFDNWKRAQEEHPNPYAGVNLRGTKGVAQAPEPGVGAEQELPTGPTSEGATLKAAANKSPAVKLWKQRQQRGSKQAKQIAKSTLEPTLPNSGEIPGLTGPQAKIQAILARLKKGEQIDPQELEAQIRERAGIGVQ